MWDCRKIFKISLLVKPTKCPLSTTQIHTTWFHKYNVSKCVKSKLYSLELHSEGTKGREKQETKITNIAPSAKVMGSGW